jgi:hypothetical protein
VWASRMEHKFWYMTSEMTLFLFKEKPEINRAALKGILNK